MPKTQPVQAAPVTPQKPCAECAKGKKCTNPKKGWTEYGCWCGGSVAPAADAKLEGQIPKDESTWGSWVDEKGLPRPLDGVDDCCMKHDLELGKARQSDPKLGFNSKSSTIAGINKRLSECFARESKNKNNSSTGRNFASRGSYFFSGMSWYNTPSAGSTGALMSRGVGSGGVGSLGSSSALTGATHSIYP